MKHTQGTWEATQGKSLSPIVGIREKSFFKICELNRKFPFSNEEAEANAKLIAAAPKLLEALTLIRGILQDRDNGTGKYKNLICHADTMINKATQ